MMLRRKGSKKLRGVNGLTLFQEETLANLEVLQGSVGAEKMTETSGRICSESYKSSSPIGLLTKILLEDSQWTSTKCYLTWRVLDMKHGHLLFQLVPLMPIMSGNEYSLLPTPTALEWKDVGYASTLKKLDRGGASRPQDLFNQKRFAEGYSDKGESELIRADDGVSDWMDRVNALGNAVVPQQVYPFYRAIVMVERGYGL